MTVNAYTLPAATVADLPSEVRAVAYVAVKGEINPMRTVMGAEANVIPPSVLADLNGKTCPSCISGVVFDDFQPPYPCPDCAGTGRALLTIQHECDDWDADVHCRHHARGGRCCLCGVVSDPRRWTVDELWPVVGWTEYRTNMPPGVRAPFVIILLDGGLRLYRHTGSINPITVTGPPPSPGEYVVALTLQLREPAAGS